MTLTHINVNTAARSIDQRLNTVEKFTVWKLSQLKALCEKDAPIYEREHLKQMFLATTKSIYARTDGWIMKHHVLHNMHWDVIHGCLLTELRSAGKSVSYGKAITNLYRQHTEAYFHLFDQKLVALVHTQKKNCKPEGIMK